MTAGKTYWKYATFLSVWMVFFALNACARHTIGMDVVYRSKQCHSKKAGLVSLENRESFEVMIAADAPFMPKQDMPELAELDFQKKHFVLIAMGEKPTAGYRLQSKNDAPKLEGNALFLPIQFEEPGDDMQANVVTSPCLVVSLDKGAYQIVRVHDYSLAL